MLKLKSAFEKMVAQLFTEAEIDIRLKEEIHMLFMQLLLKYSIPSKLNELDSLIQRQPSTIYDVTDPNTISSILSSYVAEPALELDRFIAEEEAKISEDISLIKEKERKVDESLAYFSNELSKWIKASECAFGKIKKQTQ